jgi:hypothetical protein
VDLRAWSVEGDPVNFTTASGYDQNLDGTTQRQPSQDWAFDINRSGWRWIPGCSRFHSLDLEYSLEDPRISIKDRRSIYAWSLDAPYREDLLAWATYQKDNQRSGRFGKTILMNQSPNIRPILSQTIAQGSTFFPINLVRFGFDPDDSRRDLTWSVDGFIELQVSIDENQIVSIEPPDAEWTGEENLVLQFNGSRWSKRPDKCHLQGIGRL